MTAAIEREFGGLDFLVHGAAFAPQAELKNPFVETSREGFFSSACGANARSRSSAATARSSSLSRRPGMSSHGCGSCRYPRAPPLKAAHAAALVAQAAATPAAARLSVVRGRARRGGYVAGPVGLAAVVRRTPFVLIEADSHLGLTNRLLAPFARRVCLAFALPGAIRTRYVVTGRPVRHRPSTGRLRADASGSDPRRRACSCSAARSARARSTTPRSRRSRGAFPRAPRRRRARSGALESPGPHYDLRGYISDFGEALLASDLVVPLGRLGLRDRGPRPARRC